MATSIFDHPVILLIVVAASILRWLWQKSQAEKPDAERPVVPDQPIPRASENQTEEERIRRFLEALGQPPGSAPPTVAPKRRVQPRIFPTLPPLTTAPPALPPTQAPPPLPMEERIFKPAIVQETGFEVRDVALQTSGEPTMETPPFAVEQSDFRVRLASPQGLRSAIVLREIFGPPRSLQPFDLVSGL